jgi:hypothetical protein
MPDTALGYQFADTYVNSEVCCWKTGCKWPFSNCKESCSSSPGKQDVAECGGTGIAVTVLRF